MPLKYKFTEIFRGKFPSATILFKQLEDLQNQIDNGVEVNCEPVIKNNVKLTKSSLKKAFGDAKKFDKVGVVHNEEGSYLIISDDKGFKYIALEDI